MRKFYIAMILTLSSSFGYAVVNSKATKCKNGQHVREVEIRHGENGSLGCKVYYHKPTERLDSKVLWNSSHNRGFCETKMSQFLQKLEGWGWRCDQSGSTLSKMKKYYENKHQPVLRSSVIKKSNDSKPKKRVASLHQKKLVKKKLPEVIKTFPVLGNQVKKKKYVQEVDSLE